MLFLYYGIILTASVSLIAVYYSLKKKYKDSDLCEKFLDKFTKIIILLLAIAFFFRYMWGRDSVDSIFALSSNVVSDHAIVNAMSLILNWLFYAGILTIIVFGFIRIKSSDVIIKFFAFPIIILSIVGLYPIMLGIVGSRAFGSINFRLILMSIEFALYFVACFVVFVRSGYFKVEKTDLKILWYIPLFLLAVMPPYLLEGLFGHVNYFVKLKEFTLPHRIILYFSLIIPIGLYFILAKKDYDFKKIILLFISIGTLMSFSVNHKFPDFLNVTSWPFHLCHTAMYIVVICLIFKLEKLFYFTYFINVLGAFLAMLMPNYSDKSNLFSQGIVEFFINHYIAFFMPILLVALGIYARPKLKHFKYSMIGFGIYFSLVLILNAWFSNYESVDYFFVNSDFIADKLGKWAEDLRNFVWSFNISSLNFTFYPLYQVIFFIVYCLLGAGMWFVYEQVYNYTDLMKDMAERKKKYKLDELALLTKLNGRTVEEPMNSENKNKMILHDFTKRYGKSDVYAVKDANLEVHGGEIFGFLGSNGAGKSTIIKSIVGIQPITSGSIEVCGYDVEKQAVMAKQNIGFVPDHYALYEKLTGREYINYIADLYNVSCEDREKRINKYVKNFELEGAFDNPMKTYSHGMKQKIAIMSALVHNPKLWILDEPLTGLDPNSIFQVKECMKQHAKAGNIVFFSSHIIDVVERICDRIGIIKKGQIQCVKSVKEIEESGQTLEQFYMDTINNSVVRAVKVKDETTDKKIIAKKSKEKRKIKNVQNP